MERVQSIDLVKIIATIGVIALHSTYKYISPNCLSLADIIYDSGVISMPLFFMVSGYLLIPRNSNTYSYVANKIFRIVRFVFLINLIYSSVSFFRGVSNITDFFYDFLGAFVQKGTFSIFWYFGAIIICYLFLPLLSKLYRSQYKYLTLFFLLFIFSNIVFSQTLTTSIDNFAGILEYKVPATFRFWYIFLYFILGGLAHKISYSPNLWIIGVLGLTVFGYIEYFDNLIGEEHCSIFYSSTPIIIYSFFIFLYFVNNCSVSGSLMISGLSKLFLPVYTIHSFVISHWIDFSSLNYIYKCLNRMGRCYNCHICC